MTKEIISKSEYWDTFKIQTTLETKERCKKINSLFFKIIEHLTGNTADTFFLTGGLVRDFVINKDSDDHEHKIE